MPQGSKRLKSVRDRIDDIKQRAASDVRRVDRAAARLAMKGKEVSAASSEGLERAREVGQQFDEAIKAVEESSDDLLDASEMEFDTLTGGDDFGGFDFDGDGTAMDDLDLDVSGDDFEAFGGR